MNLCHLSSKKDPRYLLYRRDCTTQFYRYYNSHYKDPYSSFFSDYYIFSTVDGRNSAPVDAVDITVFIGIYTSQVQDF